MYSKFTSFKLKNTIFLVFTLLSLLGAEAKGVINTPKVSFKSEKATLVNIFSTLSEKTNYKFSYGESIIEDKNLYTVTYTNSPIETVLKDLSQKAHFTYNISNKLVLIKKEAAVKNISDVQQTVKGKVLDENGMPLPGASVMEVGTNNIVATDLDGNFEIMVAQGKILEVSFIGYKTRSVLVDSDSLSIQLESNASELDEVVVVGYGKQTKADLTGSVTQLEEDNFRLGVNVSADQLLQGKVAGVRVVQASGEPGAPMDVTIRGVGSIRSGSTPLFVVDGVPLTNDDASPAGQNVGFGTSRAKNPLNFLNTSDIESISVLKDASAAAIYGARGSNGVVIITTKKGKKGEATFTVDSYLGFSKVSKKLDVLSASEYRNALTDPAFDHGGDTDWQDVIYRNAVTTNNVMAFSKQTDTGNYYVSLGQMDQEGIVNNSNFKRTSGRINAAESFFDKRLRLSANLTASETVDNGVPTSDDGGSNGQLIIHTLMANPTQPVFDENGEYQNFNMNAHYNPAYLLSIYNDETRTIRVLGNFEASLRLAKGLDYKLNIGVDRSMSERNTTIYPNVTDLNPIGKYIQGNLESKSQLIEDYLTYNWFNDKHKVEVLGGFSYQKFERSGTAFSIDDIADQEIGVNPADNPAFSGYQTGVTGFAQENELQSFFGRVNYAFNKKYLITASMRADGSTRFGENNKYGYFPSFAGGWVISQESFLKENKVIENLKLRASWGQTGNQEVQNKITKASYALSGADGYYLYDDLGLVNGVSVSRTPNPDLKWEVVTQFDLGIDFSLWNGKLYGTLDYFNKTTTDAILNIPSPVLSPTNTIWVNIDGEIVNKGFEFMLGSQIIDNSDFKWSVDFNGATLDNEVKNLPVSEILSGAISGPGQSGVLANIYKSGYAAGSFYLIEHVGFDENGAEIFKDQNGDGAITGDDRVIIEGALPKFTYGFNSQMNYKNFDFSFSIIGQSGGYLVNNTGLNALNINNLASDRNTATDYYNSGANPANSPQLSTLYLEKSDFLRLNTARLGYNFKIKNLNWLQGLNLYVTGQNLFTITDYSGYDPLINSAKSSGGNQSLGIDYSSYPSARTFILGATLKL
ncbi:SusC/RagA family TonB-linked outer membrane protein [Flavobacterium alkalisoli]|uniref:SusC/RagA family TonB-linked outer membrane protein n=1 Tax=Flavobacterium alkalisoli TaxID=2602769 RepID=A0A5B9FS77_9FLAO|nr:SusC/RagA family TonB-linked outer membrane protein [Flavobacterium alkalisoli]QEE49774.1 SusC/RagA family TonB-linked outer membrane protein [Flavobacterium alkalisoli]